MDPRGGKTISLAAAGGLTRLSRATGVEFPAIVAAREETETQLAKRRRALADLRRDADAATVLMGSWGRLEVTQGSDDDFMCLIDGPHRAEAEVRPTIEETWKALGSSGKSFTPT
jgi:UTP:GlnB (protein PII) uridylyltransferase